VERGLVLFDTKQVVAALVQDGLGQGCLGVQGSGGHHPPAQGQRSGRPGGVAIASSTPAARLTAFTACCSVSSVAARF
jgi:hypothetical protein